MSEDGDIGDPGSGDDGSLLSAPKVMPPRDLAPPEPDEPGRLFVAPLRLVTSALRNRKQWIAIAAVVALVIHAGFATFFMLLLDFRDLPDPSERAIPIEIVPSMPEQRTPPVPPPAVPPPPPPGPPPPAPSTTATPPPFVAAPPEARRATSQSLRATPASPPPDPQAMTNTAPPAGPPPAAPSVISAEGGTFAVMPAAPEPAKVPPEDRPRPKAPSDASSTLAQALPMDLSAFPSTFQAVLSGGGAQAGLEYKGLVYGRIQRSHRAMEEARTRHLRGQVSVSFRVDQQGHATDLTIAVSSGDPALDDLGLAMIREAEPFPPPPPGADQLFTPAFAVGEE